MLEVARAKLFRFFVVAEIVVAVRHAQPALVRHGNHLRTVLEIRRRSKSKGDVVILPMEPRNFGIKPFAVLDGLDGGEIGSKWLAPRGVDRGGVHATRIEIADFLFVRSGSRFGICGAFQNCAHAAEIFVAQHGK